MKVTAVVPVYNEEKTIESVLRVLTSSEKVHEIIVVDDGSTDGTLNIIKQFRVKVVVLKKNTGKGNAIRIATRGVKSNIILLIDGDLIGLKEEHIGKLLKPILNEGAAMTIGLREKGNIFANMLMPYFPLIGGERAILTKVFMEIRKNPLIGGWGLESVLNHYCKKKKLKVAKVRIYGMNHIGLQIKKYGFISFLKEIYEVALIRIKLLRIKYD